MSSPNNYILEGTGVPKIIFDSGFAFELAEPNGEGDTRSYSFPEQIKDTFWNELDELQEVGKKFIFNGQLSWVTLNKAQLQRLFQAQGQYSIMFRLNKDREDIQFRCKVKVAYKFIAGKINHPGGYSVTLTLIGTELLTVPGYTTQLAEQGYGSNYGEDVGNQSP